MEQNELYINEKSIDAIKICDFEDSTQNMCGKVIHKKGEAKKRCWIEKLFNTPIEYYKEDLIEEFHTYTRSEWNDYIKKYLNPNHIFIGQNDIIYYKPIVKLFISNNGYHNKWFDTFEEAKKYAEDLMSRNKYIKVY